MEDMKNARRAGDLANLQCDGREECGSLPTANCHFISDADEEALRLARAWRDDGRWDAWYWLVGRLVQAQKAGRKYESLRRLTDELSQVHDFCNVSL